MREITTADFSLLQFNVELVNRLNDWTEVPGMVKYEFRKQVHGKPALFNISYEEGGTIGQIVSRSFLMPVYAPLFGNVNLNAGYIKEKKLFHFTKYEGTFFLPHHCDDYTSLIVGMDALCKRGRIGSDHT